MTPTELFWRRVNRKAAALHPHVAAAYLRALRELRASMTGPEFERLIRSGAIDRIVTQYLSEERLDRTLAAFRAELQKTIAEATTYFGRSIPGAPDALFNVLSPRVVEAVRALDTRVMVRLKADIREGVRAFVETGLRAGANSRETARHVREIIGMAPNQSAAVMNFRRMLETGDREALTRELRDRRFDRSLQKALGKGGTGLSPTQIERMTAAYERRMIAFHAETVSRTATLDSFKAGQRLSWQSAIDRGIVDAGSLMQTWVGVMDKRERPEHVAMEGETVRFDQPFSNGEIIPGETTFNCRCLARVFVSRERKVA